MSWLWLIYIYYRARGFMNISSDYETFEHTIEYIQSLNSCISSLNTQNPIISTSYYLTHYYYASKLPKSWSFTLLLWFCFQIKHLYCTVTFKISFIFWTKTYLVTVHQIFNHGQLWYLMHAQTDSPKFLSILDSFPDVVILLVVRKVSLFYSF